jgi:hypothetical protein
MMMKNTLYKLKILFLKDGYGNACWNLYGCNVNVWLYILRDFPERRGVLKTIEIVGLRTEAYAMFSGIACNLTRVVVTTDHLV